MRIKGYIGGCRGYEGDRATDILNILIHIGGFENV